MAERWPTIRETSEKTGYNAEHLRRLVRSGKVRAELIGRVYFVDPTSLRAYMDEMSKLPQGGPQGEVGG